MNIAKPGLDLIKSYESLSLKAYRDSGGVPTIGWGSTRGVRMGMQISQEQAESRLRDDLYTAESAVNRYVTVPLSQHQFDALVSFVFNVGGGAFRKSTLLEKLNLADYAGAANELSRWVKANGRVLPGLVKRRAAERALFLSESANG